MSIWPKLALLLIAQLAALTVMIADKQWTLNHGTPVILQTEPVDPRSLFMGDFAHLNYRISRLTLDGEKAVGGDKEFRRHDTIWVALQPAAQGDDGARAVSVHHRREDVPPGLLALKGEVQHVSEVIWDNTTRKTVQQMSLTVRYGIEQYYVQEGTGQQIERPAGGEKVSIVVAIDARGKAGIQAVLLDGKERYRETLF